MVTSATARLPLVADAHVLELEDRLARVGGWPAVLCGSCAVSVRSKPLASCVSAFLRLLGVGHCPFHLIHLPLLLVSISQPDRDRVHRQQDHHEDDDRRGRERLELLLGIGGPAEDLDRQRRELAVEEPAVGWVANAIAPTTISGAVSPIARESARITPVAMPGIEAGSTCFQIVCHLVAPSAIEPSRIEGGTARIASRPATMTTGRTRSPRVRPPASTTFPRLERSADQERQPEHAVDDRGNRREVLDVHLDEPR